MCGGKCKMKKLYIIGFIVNVIALMICALGDNINAEICNGFFAVFMLIFYIDEKNDIDK